ncbi:MAG: CsbD family protein [Acidimicrobiia bacterium]
MDDGTMDQVKGRAKQVVGDATGRDDLHREGTRDEKTGKLKDKLEDAKDWVEEKIDDVRR